MTNTNVINNANTTVYATVENRNVNDNSQMLMIGEELLCVRKAHDTMYIVNDATQAYVQAYVHQVVGNIACDTVVTQEGNDVHVTLKEVDMMACGPVLNDEQEICDMLESIDATVKPVVKLPMEKLVMLKSEQLIAESVIPMLFANMVVGDIYSEKSVSAKQVIAA